MVGDGEASNDRNSREMRVLPLAGLVSIVQVVPLPTSLDRFRR